MPGKNQRPKRQSASSRLSPALSQRPPIRRVKRIYLPLSFKRQLLISFRRFRTSKSRRSKKYRQLVIQANLFSYREIAVTTVRKRRPKAKAAAVRRPLLLSARALTPILLIAVGLGGGLFSMTHLTHSVSLDLKPSPRAAASGVVLSQQAASPKVMPASVPQHIRIPSIGVDTDIVSTGLGDDGSIAMPQSVDVGAWYSGSPTPGEKGPAIIAGHVDNYEGTGAFFRLRETQIGDTIEVERADGSTAVFKVAQIKQVPQANFPTQEVFGNINYAGIRVITCGGVFNTQTHEYEDNIVVFGILQ